MSVQKPNGENRFKQNDDQPLMCNVHIDLNPNNVVAFEITSPVNPNNAVINEAFKSPNLDEAAPTEVVLDRCEGSNTSNILACDTSSELDLKQINESHTSHAPIRVSKQDGQRCILPTWTRRIRSSNDNVAASGECSSRKKGRKGIQRITPSCHQNVFRLLRMRKEYLFYWWRLIISLARSNELLSMELLWA